MFEALTDVQKRYSIDADRVVMRGFSMGGASAWQFATHHADKWVAASPGAGFSETAEFSRAFGPNKTPPPWYEQTLWHWYDSIDYAVNLTQLPTVAYNGDMDGQKQAADRMQDALAKENMTLTRVIGKNMGHGYTKEGKEEINAFIDPFVAKGRVNLPQKIRFTTWTLRYNRMNWLIVTGLEQHWKRARVDAELTAPRTVTLKTENVTSLFLDAKRLGGMAKATIDGQAVGAGLNFYKVNGRWGTKPAPGKGLQKRRVYRGRLTTRLWIAS